MIKTHQIYKTDKWNMMTVEVKGKSLVLREISDQWGEDTYVFLSRPEMMKWAHERFPKAQYADNEQEWEQIIERFSQI